MTAASRLRVLAIDGSPTGGGRTRAAVEAVAEGAAGDAETEFAELAGGDVDSALAAIARADAYIVGSPVYRASFAAPLKTLLDRVPRGLWGEHEAPLTGRAVAVVATGASYHHFLALNDLRNVLSGFFAAFVLPPGLYVPREEFGADRSLSPDLRERAKLQGQGLVELARALSASTALRAVEPQA